MNSPESFPPQVTNNRPWYKKKRVWLSLIVGLFVLGALFGDSEQSQDETDATDSPQPTVAVSDGDSSQTTENAQSSEPDETVSQSNARRSAEMYLRVSAFSRSGLIDQLEFEGFSNSDATYAVDVLEVDWNEQAAKSAAQYLEFSAFSRSGLVDQLIFEGFTKEEAEYGVRSTGL